MPSFLSLLDSSQEVLALVTRPTPPTRGRGPAPVNPMRQVAESRGVLILEPASINSAEALACLASLRADLLVVCDYGQILKSATLSLARLGGVNLHGSLLPRYRGAAPVHWAIYHGETETGVTVIHMTPQLDGGPVLAVRRVTIGCDETTAELESRLAELGVAPVREALGMLEAWDGTSALGQPQDPALASRAPRLTKADGNIDWTRSAQQIHNQVRAFKPWPGCYSHWQTPKGDWLRLILDQVSVVPPGQGSSCPADVAPGTIQRKDEGCFWVATGDGPLSIDRLQPAGKRVMNAAEFLRGHPVEIGQRLEAR